MRTPQVRSSETFVRLPAPETLHGSELAGLGDGDSEADARIKCSGAAIKHPPTLILPLFCRFSLFYIAVSAPHPIGHIPLVECRKSGGEFAPNRRYPSPSMRTCTDAHRNQEETNRRRLLR